MDHPTPFFLFDLEVVRRKYHLISRAFPGASVYYSVRTNNHPRVLRTLMSCGSRFDVGSKQEADLMLELGVHPEELIFSAPVKLPSHIRDTHLKGVDLFVFDSEEELKKLAILAPGSRVLLRLAVNNEGSLLPFSMKFGAPTDQALSLMLKAKNLELFPAGLAFHVGSQCERKETWGEAMELAGEVRGLLESESMSLYFLSIGGGFPIPYNHEVPSIGEIAREVQGVFSSKFPPGIELMLEPGRYLVADTAVMVSTVIGKAHRGDKDWLFIDASTFHGLFESFQVKGKFPYQVRTPHDTCHKKQYVLSGPTCNPDDTILNEVWLPEVKVGDRIYIMDTGAYSFVYASNFHGFSAPSIHFVSEGVVDSFKRLKRSVSELERLGHSKYGVKII